MANVYILDPANPLFRFDEHHKNLAFCVLYINSPKFYTTIAMTKIHSYPHGQYQ